MLRPGLSWAPPPAPPTAAAADRYLSGSVENASPAELTGMLFTEALRCIDTALELHCTDQPLDAIAPIVKAQAIVIELRTSLNPEAGDIAITLDSVYDWVHHNLVASNTKRDAAPLREARTCLAEIAEAWNVAVLGRPAGAQA